MSNTPQLTDVKKIRDRTRQHIEEGAVTAGYGADRGGSAFGAKRAKESARGIRVWIEVFTGRSLRP